jgi:hypothetical protein
MQIEAEYSKCSHGIKAKMIIRDEEDFDSSTIFYNLSDEPTNPGWELKYKKGGTDCLINCFKTYEEAKGWVELQASALEEKLGQWRDANFPISYYFK